MPESPKTRYRVPRAQKLGGNLTVPKKKRSHELILRRGRAGWLGECACGSWRSSGNESKIRFDYTDHIARGDQPAGHEPRREIADPLVKRPRYFSVCACGWRSAQAMPASKLAGAHAEHVRQARAQGRLLHPASAGAPATVRGFSVPGASSAPAAARRSERPLPSSPRQAPEGPARSLALLGPSAPPPPVQ
jgi:hypothetical protein